MISFLRAKNFVLDLIFPRICAGCKKEGTLLCEECRNKLNWVAPACFVCGRLSPPRNRIAAGRTCLNCRKNSHIYAFFAPFIFEDKIARELTHNLKYLRVGSLAEIISGLLAEYFLKYKIVLPEGAVVIPVPLHKSRQRTRGFNQAALIASDLAKKLNLEYRPEVLLKTKSTKPQVELSASERKVNLSGAFALKNPDLIKNKIILLLDDVKTTGATLEEAAKVLKNEGAKQVWAIAFAR